MQSIRQINSKATAQLYWQLRKGLVENTVHPYKASNVIIQAIQNGHDPPETNRKSRNHFRALIVQYSHRGMHAHAMEEIKRCVDRGHIDEFSLIAPIADEYLTSLMEPRILKGTTTPQSRVPALKKAARYLKQLAADCELSSVKPATIARLIEAMDEPVHRAHCDVGILIDVLLQNGMSLSTKSWNTKLRSIRRDAGSASKVAECLRMMSEASVPLDRLTVSIALKGLRGNEQYRYVADELLSTAKRRGLFDHVTALEELKQLKDREMYQSVLMTYASYYGDDVLLKLGFLPATLSNTIPESHHLTVTTEVLSLVLDALVRINPLPDQIRQLHQAYLELIKDNSVLQDDVYAQSVFIKAFSRHLETMEDALKMLEHMRLSEHKPTEVTYTSILEGLVKHGAVNLASTVLQQMRIDGLIPTPLTWNCLVRGYLLANDTESAIACYRQAQEVGCEILPETQALIDEII